MVSPDRLLVSLIAGVAGCSSAYTPERGQADASALSGDDGSAPESDPGDDTDDPQPPDSPSADAGEAGTCDPWLQDCPEGRKCSFEWVEGEYTTTCVPVSGDPQPIGAPCTVFGASLSGVDDCEAGAICSFVDSEQAGICLGLCEGSPIDPACADANSLCRICQDCPSVCTERCDPLDDTCAALGLLCLPFDTSFGCWEAADADAAAEFGEPCEFANQCGAGLACVGADEFPGCNGAGCCTKYCDLTLEDACVDPLACQPYFDGADTPAEYATLGVCVAA